MTTATTRKPAARKPAATTRKPAVPATAKQPADRKPAAPKPADGLAVVVRGVELSVPQDALSDWELMDALAQIDSGDVGPDAILYLPGILRRLAGDQHKALMNAARDPHSGRVSIDTGVELIGELFTAVKDQAGHPNP